LDYDIFMILYRTVIIAFTVIHFKITLEEENF